MATITITREFTQYTFPNVPLLSVHVPSSMEFEFDRGAISGSYAEVVINSYTFKAIKTGTVGNVDTYTINGDMLKYLLPIPTFNPLVADNLVLSCTVVCNGYNSSGTLIATANHSSFKICHALTEDKDYGLYVLQTSGRINITPVYYTGYLTYFDVTNQVYKKVSSVVDGSFTDDGCSFNVKYFSSEVGTAYYWLNSSGCWDSWLFSEISNETKKNQSSPIQLYADQLINWKGYEFNMQNEVEETKTYRVIAKDTDHYAQLYYLTKTPIIMNQNGELFELTSQPAPLTICKQNLNFTFSLKRKIHAQSY